jgi:hypothetical protein
LDACCPLAVIGLAVLPPSLRERLRAAAAGELDALAAEAVRAELDALAGLLAR